MPSSQITVSSGTIETLNVTQAFVLTPQLVTAAGSNSQAAATPITRPAAVIVTVSATSRGVRLPPASPGLTELITNAGDRSVRIFPASGDRIGVLATNQGTSMPFGKGAIFLAQDDTTWRVIQGE